MKIKLIVGDWSGDGHERTEDFLIESNLSQDQIAQAIIQTENLFEFTFSDFCSEYEDNTIHSCILDKFIEAQIIDKDFLDDLFCDEDYDHECHHCETKDEDECVLYYEFTPEAFVELYLRLAKYSIPAFEYIYLDDRVPTIEIGGYGLFN